APAANQLKMALRRPKKTKKRRGGDRSAQSPPLLFAGSQQVVWLFSGPHPRAGPADGSWSGYLTRPVRGLLALA
ncbi:MAG: hypothetical protein ACKOB4_19490, partial [Acidobacteriota bacterium]